jgi:chemosensory pili system protein ChpB (putative protein-glutamate methylesterase)
VAEALALKVVLLARAGEARVQLRRAITDLGAELVVEADPNDLAEGAIAACGANTVLVSVEPAVEAALDRLEDELLAPGITVMFDEAATTSALAGWDQARWARHLAAKLLGGDVLPPGAVPDAHQEAAEHLVPGAPDDLDLDLVALGEALGAAETAPRDDDAIDLRGIELIELDGIDGDDAPRATRSSLSLLEARELSFGEFAVGDDAAATDASDDEAFARLAAAFDQNLDALDSGVRAEPAAPAPAARAAFDFSALAGLELSPMSDEPAAPPPMAVARVSDIDFGHLSLSPLADESAPPAEAGAVLLVLSGVGGPDAVRQLLRALPAHFPLAVLLRQTLDGGRHDRFVEQLAKISRLPVAMAGANETPPPKAVRLLPDGLASAGALRFPAAAGVTALIDAASARDGAVVVLSGTDDAAIEPLKRALADGLRVLVQDPASCFDGKAAAALRDAGATALPAADLAARLDAFFPS